MLLDYPETGKVVTTKERKSRKGLESSCPATLTPPDPNDR